MTAAILGALAALVAVIAVALDGASGGDPAADVREPVGRLPETFRGGVPDVLGGVDVPRLLDRGADGPAPAAGFACLTAEPCARWTADVADVQAADGTVAVEATDGAVVVAGPRGVVVLDGAGGRRWEEPGLTDAPARLHGVAVTEGLVLALVGGRELVALDVSTGDLRWSRPLRTHRRLRLLDAERVRSVVVLHLEETRGTTEHVHAYAAADGAARWRRWAERVVVGGSHPVLVDAGRLRGVEPSTGSTVWRRSTDGDRAPVAYATSAGLPALERPATGDGPGELVVLDPASGEVRARHPGRVLRQTRGATHLVLRRGDQDARRVVALDGRGRPVWDRRLPAGICCGVFGASPSPLLVLGPGPARRVHVLDVRDGSLQHDGRAPSDRLLWPLGERTLVVQVTGDRRAVGLDLVDGTARWRAEELLPVGAQPDGSPLVRVGSSLVAVAEEVASGADGP